VRYAIGKWITPIVIVEVDPEVFDDSAVGDLLAKLDQHFMQPVAMITPDWEASTGIRAQGLACPIEMLAAADVVWRELVLPSEAEIPF
jgi:hypothetical protein